MDTSKVKDRNLLTRALASKTCFHYQRIGWFFLLVFLIVLSLVAVVKFCGYKKSDKDTALSHGKRFVINYQWKELRLPKSIYPMRYWLHFTLHPYDWEFYGEVKIQLKVEEDTNILVLNSDGLTAIAAEIVDSNEKLLPIVSQSAYSMYESLIIETAEPFKKGEIYFVLLTYVANIKGDSTGIYKQTYLGRDGLPRFYIGSHFYPINARKAFPCFDDPNTRAVFSISISHPNHTVVLSSTEIEHSDFQEDGMVTDKFIDTPPLAPHHLAIFLFDDLENITETTTDGITIRLWCSANLVEQARNVTAEIRYYHQKYTEFFGIPDAVGKMDFLVLTHLPSFTMEYWGLYVYEEYYLFPEEEWQLIIRSLMLAASVGHEWFGCSTSFGWWDEFWIEKGIVGALAFHVIPQTFAAPRLALFSKFTVMDSESNFTLPPLFTPINSIRSIRYFSIEQTKAIALIRMIDGTYGAHKFAGALKTFMTRHKWQSVTASQFWSVFDEAASFKYKTQDIIQSWIDSEGFPIVTAKKVDENNIQLDLTRLMLNRGRYYKFYKDEWIVPFNYITSKNQKRQLTWIKGTEPTKIEDSSDWMLGNIDLKGYYVTNYEESMWKKLFIHLLSNDSGIKSGVALMMESTSHDLTKLGRAGLLPESIGVNVDLLRYAIAQKLGAPSSK